MIYTHEDVGYSERRLKFRKAVIAECKEVGCLDCLASAISIMNALAFEDLTNAYQHKELNDAYLERIIELHDAGKESPNEKGN